MLEPTAAVPHSKGPPRGGLHTPKPRHANACTAQAGPRSARSKVPVARIASVRLASRNEATVARVVTAVEITGRDARRAREHRDVHATHRPREGDLALAAEARDDARQWLRRAAVRRARPQSRSSKLATTTARDLTGRGPAKEDRATPFPCTQRNGGLSRACQCQRIARTESRPSACRETDCGAHHASVLR
ncbi:MAG: hypothetical protein QOI41_4962 [Myxococcales bacterium]|nr:hypothetical protein [Myxococcales bacterium]